MNNFISINLASDFLNYFIWQFGMIKDIYYMIKMSLS